MRSQSFESGPQFLRVRAKIRPQLRMFRCVVFDHAANARLAESVDLSENGAQKPLFVLIVECKRAAQPGDLAHHGVGVNAPVFQVRQQRKTLLDHLAQRPVLREELVEGSGRCIWHPPLYIKLRAYRLLGQTNKYAHTLRPLAINMHEMRPALGNFSSYPIGVMTSP